jgi:hypothetical protein
MLQDDEQHELMRHLLNGGHDSCETKKEEQIVITRHKRSMHDGFFKIWDLDILCTLQVWYVLPYFILSFLSLVFIYFFYDAIALIWSYRDDCDAKIIYWMLAFFVMCPVIALGTLVTLMKIY